MAGHVPWRGQAQTTALDVLEHQGALGRVVDLGCGPGSFTRAVLARRRGSAVTAVDHDPLMLALARASLGGRAAVLDADLGAPHWPAALPGPVDAVVACAVLHMVDASDYAAAVTTIASALRPGGLFVDVDEVPLPPSSGRLAEVVAQVRQQHLEARAAEGHEDFRAWMQGLRAQPEVSSLVPLRDQRLAGRPEVRVAHRDERAGALRRAGFTEVAEVHRTLDTAVLVAVRR